MGLSTHVLDTMHGIPAAGMAVALFRTYGGSKHLLQRFVLNDDGRPCGVSLPEPNFLQIVGLDFGVAQTDQHYHVPLLVSPWSYSTYRGS